MSKKAPNPEPSFDNLELQNLPSITRLIATCKATQPQRLPPLPTTSLHGALGHSLRHLAQISPLLLPAQSLVKESQKRPHHR